MNRALGIAGALGAVLLFGYAFAQWQKRASMFFPDRYPLGDWDRSFPIKPSDEWFQSSDGLRLHGWLFRATSSSAPAMVWFHGNAGNLTSRAPIAAELARRGVTTFVFDYRGFGRSDGSPAENALFDDSRAAYDHLREIVGPATPMILYGESLGGPYAARMAMERPSACVIVENSFPSLSALGNSMYHPLPLGWFVGGSLTTSRWLNRAGKPTLVMHGRADEVIPFSLGQQLYEELRVEKEFYVSNAGHSEISAVEGSRFYDTVLRFIAAHTGATGKS